MSCAGLGEVGGCVCGGGAGGGWGGVVGERMSPWLPVRLGGDITRGEQAG